MKRILLFAAAALMLFACSKEDVSPAGEQQKSGVNKTVFHASIEGTENPGTGTKVYSDEDLKVLWNEDDRLSVFNKRTLNDQYMFMGEDGDNSGDFEEIPINDPVSWTALDHIYAVYPFSPDNTINSEGSQITVNLPVEQSYKEHSFGIGANTMVAVTDNNYFAFKNVCGYLKFRFYGGGIEVKSITFAGNNGEKIAGKAYITPVSGGTPSISLDNTATGAITITCEEPVTLGSSSTDATEFIFVIPPTTFTGGFKIMITDVNGRTFEKSSTRSLAISRNKMESMGAMKVETSFGGHPFSISASEQVFFSPGLLAQKNGWDYGFLMPQQNYQTSEGSIYFDSWEILDSDNFCNPDLGGGVNDYDGWFILSRDEWMYLLEERVIDGGSIAPFYPVMANSNNGSIFGILLPPDDAQSSDVENLSETYPNTVDLWWYTLKGFVFLPASGYSSGGSVELVGQDGIYWSRTLDEENTDAAYYFDYFSVWPGDGSSIGLILDLDNSIEYVSCEYGLAVRLVHKFE